MAALEDWDAEAVVAWLSSLQLERYAPAFRKYRVDGRRLALGLSEKFMSAQLRINVRLHRLKIQQSSSELRAAARRRRRRRRRRRWRRRRRR